MPVPDIFPLGSDLITCHRAPSSGGVEDRCHLNTMEGEHSGPGCVRRYEVTGENSLCEVRASAGVLGLSRGMRGAALRDYILLALCPCGYLHLLYLGVNSISFGKPSSAGSAESIPVSVSSQEAASL